MFLQERTTVTQEVKGLLVLNYSEGLLLCTPVCTGTWYTGTIHRTLPRFIKDDK